MISKSEIEEFQSFMLELGDGGPNGVHGHVEIAAAMEPYIPTSIPDITLDDRTALDGGWLRFTWLKA